MFLLTENLHPAQQYSFQTSPSGRSLPISVKQFLASKLAAEQLITVDDGIGADSTRIWSTYDGWNVNSFAKMVQSFVEFIDKKQKINPEFVDCVIRDRLTVLEAVSTWFLGTDISVLIVHHLEGSSGLLDIDIEGIHSVRRVVLPMDIKADDMFNVYYGESSKGGATWKTDLVTTLNNYFQHMAAECL